MSRVVRPPESRRRGIGATGPDDVVRLFDVRNRLVAIGTDPTRFLDQNPRRVFAYITSASSNFVDVAPTANIAPGDAHRIKSREALSINYADWGAAVTMPWFGIIASGSRNLFITEVIFSSRR